MIPALFRSSTFKSAVRFVISICLLLILLQFVNVEELLHALQAAKISCIIIAVSLLALNLSFQVLKWAYLLNRTGHHSSLRDVVASFFFGFTLGSLTPGQIGEFGGRSLNLPSGRPGIIVGLTIIDKLQVFAVMSVAGIFSLLKLFQIHSPVIITGAAAISSLFILLMVKPQLLRRLAEAAGAAKIRHRWFVHILESLSLLSPRDLAVSALLTLLFYGTVYLQLLFLFSSFSIAAPYEVFLGFSAMMLVKALLPISIADLGTRELGLVYFMSIQGIPKAVSFDASILLFFINILVPSLIGLMFLPKHVPFSRADSNV